MVLDHREYISQILWTKAVPQETALVDDTLAFEQKKPRRGRQGALPTSLTQVLGSGMDAPF